MFIAIGIFPALNRMIELGLSTCMYVYLMIAISMLLYRFSKRSLLNGMYMIRNGLWSRTHTIIFYWSLNSIYVVCVNIFRCNGRCTMFCLLVLSMYIFMTESCWCWCCKSCLLCKEGLQGMSHSEIAQLFQIHTNQVTNEIISLVIYPLYT